MPSKGSPCALKTCWNGSFKRRSKSVRSEGPLEKQESLDTYYIRNWSLWLDLHILARTAKAVLFAKGAY